MNRSLSGASRKKEPFQEPLKGVGHYQEPPRHFPDELRLSVLAGGEDAELRLEAHFLACPECREREVDLAYRSEEVAGLDFLVASPISCQQARNQLFRYYEQGRCLERDAVAHLLACEGCQNHFLWPARSVRAREVDDSAISAQD